MKRLFSFVLASFLSIAVCSGQEFMHSPDYVYGFASDYVESVADSLALFSFSKSVHVSVENTSSHYFSEDGNGFNESFEKKVGINSNIVIEDIKKYVELNNGLFTVYYYINKKEYIEKHICNYENNIKKANEFKTSTVPHAKNLVLGHYYCAYKSVENELLTYFYPESEILKEDVLNKIVETYNNMGFIFSARNYGVVNPSGVMLVRDENCKTLPGFKYKNNNGKWLKPNSFRDIDWMPCEENAAKWAYIYTTGFEYRFLFEKETNYGFVNINVPDSFYHMISDDKTFIH